MAGKGVELKQNFSHYDGKEYPVGASIKTNKGHYVVIARGINKKGKVTEYEIAEITKTRKVDRKTFDHGIVTNQILV